MFAEAHGNEEWKWWTQRVDDRPSISDERDLNAELRKFYESVMNDLDQLDTTAS